MEHRSERRLVTCVFIDIVASTNLWQRLGPERMQRLLTESFREISAIATAAGGTIEKYIGDEVFVLFGAPAAHSDDVMRALRVAESSVRWASTSTTQVSVRVGIETGEALIDLDAVGERQRISRCVRKHSRAAHGSSRSQYGCRGSDHIRRRETDRGIRRAGTS